MVLQKCLGIPEKNPMVEIIMFPSERNGELLGDIPWWMLSSKSPWSSWTFPSFSHGFAGVNADWFKGKVVQDSPIDFSWENRWFPDVSCRFSLKPIQNHGDFPAIKAGTPYKPGTSTARGTGAVSEEGAAVSERGQFFPMETRD